MLKAICAAFLFWLSIIFVQAEERPVERSSHPRGFAAAGAQSSMVSAGKQMAASRKTGSVSGTSPTTPVTTQNSAGGVANLTGSARIDARAEDVTATAVGQQNAAGNRVGNIGGK